MRALLLALALVVIAGTASAQAPDPQFLITPGEGIGPVRVGMNITDAVALMGTPKATEQRGNITRYFWFEQYTTSAGRFSPQGGAPGGLYVKARRDGTIITVVAYYAPAYMTDKGLHTGMRPDEIVHAMGEPSKTGDSNGTHYLFYDGIGFGVNVSPTYAGYNTVILITVSNPASQ